MTPREWNTYKARRARVLARLHRWHGNAALAELFNLYARQYAERAERGEW